MFTIRRRLLVTVTLLALIITMLPLAGPRTAAQMNDDTRVLEGQALQNVIAFARLTGYVQYFYPGDAAAATDWNRFMVEGMRAVEDEPDSAALITELQARFVLVAPLVQIYPAGQSAPEPDFMPDNTGDLELIAWYHEGLETNETTARYAESNVAPVFRSERLTRRADGPAPQRFPDFPEPGTTYTAMLGDSGVAVSVPLVLWMDESGTLPHTGSVAEEHLPIDIWSAESRATRLAGVALFWNAVQHSFPYFDVVEVDWLAVLSDALLRAATDPGPEAYADTLRWTVAQLQDGHGNVEPGELRAMNITRYHLPFEVQWIEEQVVITRVWGSAEDVLQPGDALLSIDGEPVEAIMAREDAYISASTPQFRHVIALRSLLTVKTSDQVVLEIEHISGEQEAVAVAAEETASDYYKAYFAGRFEEPRPEPLEQIEPGIWYLDLSRAKNTDFVIRTPEMLGAQGWIIDLRGYPMTDGVNWASLIGMMSDADTCDYIYVAKPLLTRPDQDGIAYNDYLTSGPVRSRQIGVQKFVILTDGRAISQAETALMVYRQCTDAVIVGGPSAGTNGNINVIRLPGDYVVTWTGLVVKWRDGTQHYGIGVLPDVPVNRTRQGVSEGRDEVLEAALGVVRGE